MTPDCSLHDLTEAHEEFRARRGTITDILPVRKLNEFATVPAYGSYDAAGLDLSANLQAEGYSLYNLGPGERKLFKTGLSVAIPRGYYGRIAPRSGLAYKNGIDVMAGVVDSDYRGDVGVILINLDKEAHFVVEHGMRIAQLIIEDYKPCLPILCSSLDETERGSGGFGSTGTAN
jgi:dUTP pyrophosphatase